MMNTNVREEKSASKGEERVGVYDAAHDDDACGDENEEVGVFCACCVWNEVQNEITNFHYLNTLSAIVAIAAAHKKDKKRRRNIIIIITNLE